LEALAKAWRRWLSSGQELCRRRSLADGVEVALLRHGEDEVAAAQRVRSWKAELT
jgi:hypothetical protein